MNNFILRYILRCEKDVTVHLGKELQPGSLFAAVYTKDLWKAESLTKKIQSLFRFKYQPTESIVTDFAKQIFFADIFGHPHDYGDKLFILNTWHGNRKWNYSHVTDEDRIKIEGLTYMTALTRHRFKDTHYRHLTLNIGSIDPMIGFLCFPMAIKIPVLALRYYIDIHFEFTVNNIRKSGHPQSDPLISLLYDLLQLQQKTAIALHEFIRLTIVSREQKKSAILINAEIDIVREAETTISYLKATVEKCTSLLGLIYGITKLDEKKTHASKLSTLDREIPDHVKELYYWSTIRDCIDSKNLTELNNLRTGLLHKKGISEYHPHNFANRAHDDQTFYTIFEPLHGQHRVNSAVIVCMLALLTDRLVQLAPPLQEEQISLMELVTTTFPNGPDPSVFDKDLSEEHA